MFNKLKIASGIDDEEAFFTLDSWLNIPPSEVEGVDELLFWYKKNIKDDRSLSIYRGLYQSDIDFDYLLREGSLDLEDRGNFESWTVSPEKAKEFAYPSSSYKFGVILSSVLKSSDSYLDLNFSIDYLYQKGFNLGSMYKDECGIITYYRCEDCLLDRDIEVMIMNQVTYNHFLNTMDSRNKKSNYWRNDIGDTHDSFDWDDVYCRLDNRKLKVYKNLNKVLKDFRVKPNVKC